MQSSYLVLTTPPSLESLSLKTPSPKSLSNEALLRTTHALVTEERKLTTEILWHLHEIQVRRLYAEKGYGSLFEYAVQALGYSEAAAGRRIAAMRLLSDVPEIEPAVQNGSVSLSTLSTIQSFVQRKWQRKAELVSKSEKKELVLALSGKSRRDCEKHLVALDPVAALPKEKERVVSATQTEIRFIADDELMQKLQRIKELDGHFQSHPSYLELFHRMADLALKKLDPSIPLTKRTATRTTPNATQAKSEKTADSSTSRSSSPVTLTPPAESKRYIPKSVQREVWQRDKAQCSYRSPDGKRCPSRFALQIDHKIPLAWKGNSQTANLQLLCREHNRQKAVLQLGKPVMQRYLR